MVIISINPTIRCLEAVFILFIMIIIPLNMSFLWKFNWLEKTNKDTRHLWNHVVTSSSLGCHMILIKGLTRPNCHWGTTSFQALGGLREAYVRCGSCQFVQPSKQVTRTRSSSIVLTLRCLLAFLSSIYKILLLNLQLFPIIQVGQLKDQDHLLCLEDADFDIVIDFMCYETQGKNKKLLYNNID